MSCPLTEDYATQTQQSKQHSIGTEIYGAMGQNREPIGKPTQPQSIFDKGGKNIQKEKVSSASNVGKVGQPHVNQ